MDKVIIVGIGGFLGAASRYLVSQYCTKWFGNQFPYGTLTVNVVGALLIGIILEIFTTTTLISENMKLFLTTGILGGLTTFSTFSYETISLFYASRYTLAILNTALNLFLSLGGVIAGKFIGSKCF
ncbi:MAG: fluoride efflux transporter CrcB [Mobilitalea sp.]